MLVAYTCASNFATVIPSFKNVVRGNVIYLFVYFQFFVLFCFLFVFLKDILYEWYGKYLGGGWLQLRCKRVRYSRCSRLLEWHGIMVTYLAIISNDAPPSYISLVHRCH